MGERNSEINNLLLTSIDDLELGTRLYFALKNAKIVTLSDIINRTEEELLNCPNVDRECIRQLKSLLEEKGLQLKDSQ